MDGFEYWFQRHFPDDYTEGMTHAQMTIVIRNYFEKCIHNTNQTGEFDRGTDDPLYGYINVSYKEMWKAYNALIYLSYLADLYAPNADFTEDKILELRDMVPELERIVTPLWPSVITDKNFHEMLFNTL